jgi:hypothetical protein
LRYVPSCSWLNAQPVWSPSKYVKRHRVDRGQVAAAARTTPTPAAELVRSKGQLPLFAGCRHHRRARAAVLLRLAPALGMTASQRKRACRRCAPNSPSQSGNIPAPVITPGAISISRLSRSSRPPAHQGLPRHSAPTRTRHSAGGSSRRSPASPPPRPPWHQGTARGPSRCLASR